MASPPRVGGALAVLALALLAAYGNVVLGGQTLVSTASFNPFDHRHVDASRAMHAVTNWHDQGANWWQWEPAGQFFSRAYRRGILPQWDPTLAGGIDAHVNVTQGQYFPPYALLLLLGNAPALRDAYHLLLAFGGGLGCVLLVRRWGLRAPSALVMGLAYMLGGAVTFNVNSIIGQAVATIPLPVLVMDRFLERPTAGRLAAAAAAVTAFVLTSFMPVVLSGLALLPFLLLARLVAPDEPSPVPAWRSPAARALALRFTGALALGLAGASFLLVPAFLASRADPAFQAWYAGAGQHAMLLRALPTLVSPTVAYDVNQGLPPEKQLYSHPHVARVEFWYVGIVPLLLAALASGAADPRLRRGVVFFAGAGAFVLLKVLGVPPASWVGSLPVLSGIHFIPYFHGALAFCVAGLAAIGAERVLRGQVSPRRLAAHLAGVAAVAAGFIAFAATEPRNPAADVTPHAIELLRLAALAAAVVVLVRRAAQGRLRARLAGPALVALVALELTPLALRGRARRQDVWAHPPPYVRFLKSDPSLFRIHAPNGMTVTPNVNQGLGLHGIGARHAFNVGRYQALVRKYFTAEPLFYPVPVSLLSRPRGVLDVLNVKYVVMLGEPRLDRTAMDASGFTLETEDGQYQVYRNRRVWPRAYLAARARVVSSAAEALEAVGALEGGEVVLETPVAPAAADGRGAMDGGLRVVSYAFDRVELRARTRGPAVVVLLDTLAPGWTARVNGAPARLLAANYAFRAVEVPGGPSRIVFEYRTPGLRPSAALSALAVLAMSGLAFAGQRRFIGRS